MDPSYCKISQIMPTLAFFLLLIISSVDFNQATRTLPPSDKLQKSVMIKAHLEKINKPSIKIIQSPDGDVIDCVPSHLQPAFDHPLLKGKKPLDPPQMPKGINPNEMVAESSQLWSLSGESCPEGTIPIRRTTEEDVLKKFGRKIPLAQDSSVTAGHEYAVGVASLNGTVKYYGAKAIINSWEPMVAGSNEFSLAQMWVLAGSYANNDLNTIEAGWQVYHGLSGDSTPRLFIYWTRDAYDKTGCYDLRCPGFVQTNNRIVLGGAITPLSSYMGTQYNISIHVWKDRKSGNWWLQYGSSIVGYWPSHLFTHLKHYADTIEFGGEIVNSEPSGSHTSTQMGSGHFAEEGFGKAAYFRNLQVVGSHNRLVPVSNLQTIVTNSNCYDIIAGTSNDTDWGAYFYFGGPGRNANCP